MTEDQRPLDLGEEYRELLNSHGYGFQHAVIAFIDKLRAERRCNWEFEAAELPVSVQGRSTRIDLVFRKTKPHVYLVGECKKVNPAWSNWCFSPSYYAGGQSNSDKVIFPFAWVPSLHLPAEKETRLLTGVVSQVYQNVYHLGLSVKSKPKSSGGDKDAIEHAATQACKGLSGLIEFFNARKFDLPRNQKFHFMSAIFTTARLWTTTLDLYRAQLDKGEFEPGSIQLKEAPWLWYQYHQSPELNHTAPKDEKDYANSEKGVSPLPYSCSALCVRAQILSRYKLKD